MGWTTLSVRDETLERFNDTKADANEGHVPEQSADLFLGALLDTWDAVDDGYYNDDDADAGVPDDLAERLDRIESAAREATSAAQSAEQAINEVVDR